MLLHASSSVNGVFKGPRCILRAAVTGLTAETATTSSSIGVSPNVLTIIPFAISNGVQFAKIKPVVLTGEQRGILATYNIDANECICSVPATAAVRTFPGSQPALAIPQQVWMQLPWYVQIALILLEYSKQGSSSRFADYIKVLPPSVDVPVMWKEEEWEQLKCRYFVQQVQEQKQEWQRLWLQLQEYLSAASISSDRFMWALSLARSRAFAAPYTPAPLSTALKVALAAQIAAAAAYLALGAGGATLVDVVGLSAAAGVWYWVTQQSQAQEQHALCPLLDMFNHQGDEQSECELDIWTNSFRVVASRPWQAGQQVFISYGSSSNDVLLQLYGFVETNNTKERYLVRCLPDACASEGVQPLSSTQQQVLTEVVFTRQGIPGTAAAVLEQVCDRRSSNSINGSSPAGTVPFSWLSQQAKSVCAAALQKELKQLDVNQAEDQSLIQAFEMLPAKQQEFIKLQQQMQKRQDELKQLQLQLKQSEAQQVQPTAEQQTHHNQQLDGKDTITAVTQSSTPVVVGASDSSVLGVAPGDSDATPELVAIVAEKSQDLVELQHQVSGLQQIMERWGTQTKENKELAVRYRLGKCILLNEALALLD